MTIRLNAGSVQRDDSGALTVETLEGAVTVQAGRTLTDGAGGNMTISAAAARATAGAVVFAGGALALAAGDAAVLGVVGAGEPGGTIAINAGDGASEGFGGDGGGILLNAGVGSENGAGGTITINAGTSGDAASGPITGGDISINAGFGSAPSSSDGGQVNIRAGSGGGFGGSGGQLTIASGDGIAGAAGGLNITAGNGGPVPGGAGGSIAITAGAAGLDSQGGDIFLIPGPGAGTGRRGLIMPAVDNQDPLGAAFARFNRVPEAWHHHLEDFEGGSLLADFTKYQQSAGSTTAPAIVANGLGGLIQVEPADAINNTSGIRHKTDNYNPTQRSIVFECIVQPTTVVTTVRISVGLSDQALDPDAGNGIFVRYDSGLDAAWTLVGRGGAGAGAVAGVTAPSNGTRQRLTVELSTTDNIARLYVNGVLEATSAANPAGNAAMAAIAFVQQLAAAAAQRTVRFDKFETWQDNGL